MISMKDILVNERRKILLREISIVCFFLAVRNGAEDKVGLVWKFCKIFQSLSWF